MILVVGFFAVVGIFGPSTAVVSSADVGRGDLDLLRGNEIVSPGEQVLFFYSAGLFSILEDGNVLTDERIISYVTQDSELSIASAFFEEVAQIWIENEGGTFEDAVVAIETDDGRLFYLLLSVEDGGHLAFLDELRSRVAAARATPDASS